MKPLLLGMNNPLSDDPEFDLYPYPEGSAGWRLWKMMPEGTTRKQYLDTFERRNLLRAREWDQRAAREAARALLPTLGGRLAVVLGTQVRAALGLPLAEPLDLRQIVLPCAASPMTPHAEVGFTWLAFPHPSGRNRWFNQPENMARARELLQSLVQYKMGHPLAFVDNKSGGNSGVWNEVHSGDHVIDLISGRTGTLDECLYDGDAFVTWDDGTCGTVKWYNLAPSAKVRVTDKGWEAIL